jgi:hypothetical protein
VELEREWTAESTSVKPCEFRRDTPTQRIGDIHHRYTRVVEYCRRKFLGYIHWSSVEFFLGGGGGYEHSSPPQRNQEPQLRRERTHTIVWWVVQAAAMDGIATTAEAVVVTIVFRHEKTWVWMVPKRNNVSLCT